LKPRPAAIANSARKASAATIQGSAFVLESRVADGLTPTAVPQRWQNLAPALSSAAHEMQVAPASGAPQLAQYLPVAAAPHVGQAAVESDEERGDVMRLKIVGRRFECSENQWIWD
jgi:hypothetical protein